MNTHVAQPMEDLIAVFPRYNFLPLAIDAPRVVIVHFATPKILREDRRVFVEQLLKCT